MVALGMLKGNPYTRQDISPRIMKKILERIAWLRSRGYTILLQEADLTPEQIWQQKILDVFMKFEMLGFHIPCEWFSEMTIKSHREFHNYLNSLWTVRLGLSEEEKIAIFPDHSKLFSLSHQKQHARQWWERVNLRLIDGLLSGSAIKENHRLGAMYCMMGFVHVNEEAAESFPWILEATVE
jgi:hypothetical protein